ncbi:hypothetical protein GF382_01140 [Candidatus Falkowbacteria bacterium]|nr:hypothetical protein [Candidatus Falkowbacteria bacterium]
MDSPTSVKAESEDGSIFLACKLMEPSRGLAKALEAEPLIVEKVYLSLTGPDSTIHDTVAGDGDGDLEILKQYDSLSPGDWRISIRSVAANDDVLHEGEEVVNVPGGEVANVSMNINSTKSELGVKIESDSIPDSISAKIKYFALYLSNIRADSAGWQDGSVSLGANLEVGQEYEVQVIAFGDDGTRILETEKKIITPTAEGNVKYELVFRFVGPVDPGQTGSAIVTITLGAPATVTVTVTYSNT